MRSFLPAGKRLVYAPLAGLALVVGLFILGFVHQISRDIQSLRERELVIHAQRAAEAVKAQVFERSADSQAFALNPAFRDGLARPTMANLARSQQILKHLLRVYQVYPASVVRDLSGRILVQAFLDERPAPPAAVWSRFRGDEFVFDPEGPATRAGPLGLHPEATEIFGADPVQAFASPVLAEDGRILGTITNYANGLYLEREVQRTLESFNLQELPDVSIHVVDAGGRVIARFSGPEVVYDAQAAGSLPELSLDSVSSHGDRLLAKTSIWDSRLPHLEPWYMVLGVDREAYFQNVSRLRLSSYLIALMMVIVVSCLGLLVHRIRMSQHRELSKRLQEAQEEERSRIAREIHDELGQNLTAVLIHLSLTRNTDREGLLGRMSEARDMLLETNDMVRRISRELHPSLIENLGLEAALRWKLQQLEKVKGIRGRLETTPDCVLSDLSNAAKLQVFRMVQESLNNVKKHSEATEVSVTFERKGPRLQFAIRDNGIGFKPGAQGESLGLRSIEERAESLGGKARVVSRPRQGTTVHCRIPLNKEVKPHDFENTGSPG